MDIDVKCNPLRTREGPNTPRIRCRLICLGVKEEVANRQRMRLKKEAKKKGMDSWRTKFNISRLAYNENVPEKWIPSEMPACRAGPVEYLLRKYS